MVKYKPEIIGITGSVGKTSAKEAIYVVLASKYKARRNIKNYNNEIGLPLTVIGAESPGKNIFGWLYVFLKALFLILFNDKNYPEILVLEMGVDKPGDMEYLLSIAKCDMGVVTGIGHSHLEFFGSIDKIKKEKSFLIKNLPSSGWAILNYDDENARGMAKNTKARVLTFGFNEGAQARVANIVNLYNADNKTNIMGVNFKLIYNGSAAPFFLQNVLGRPAILAALAGASVGIIRGMNLVEISEALKLYKSPAGRMSLLRGIKNTLIIDDTYNASPQSAIAALEELNSMDIAENNSRFAVLGDMLELGSFTEEGHKKVGRKAAEAGVDKLIAIGEKARHIAGGAREGGMSADSIFHFYDSGAAGIFIQEKIKEGDIVLVKGSQGMRMEKIVKEIMADPLKAKELLVRQGKEWEQ